MKIFKNYLLIFLLFLGGFFFLVKPIFAACPNPIPTPAAWPDINMLSVSPVRVAVNQTVTVTYGGVANATICKVVRRKCTDGACGSWSPNDVFDYTFNCGSSGSRGITFGEVGYWQVLIAAYSG